MMKGALNLHVSSLAEGGSDRHGDQMTDLTIVANDPLLERLPENHRVVLIKAIHGMKYKDIALELNVPIGTVRSRLHRARATMESLITKRDEAQACRT